MATVSLFTFGDAVDWDIDYLGASPTQEAARDARKAIMAAYRELCSAHRWFYYFARGRINTNAPYSTGTVAYTASTRTVTLTSGTFPSWAAYGQIVLNNIVYQVATNPTSTTLVLTNQSAPPSDISAGASYTLYRDTYPLPADCLQIEELINTNNYLRLNYEHPRSWLSRQRIIHSTAAPHIYTIRGDPHYFGTMGVSFFPAPDQAYAFDFIYQRRPRALLTDSYKTGTLSVTSGSATVNGSGSAWGGNHVGAILRIGADAVTAPTGLTGLNPYQYERTILAVPSTTQITADVTYPATYSGVLYNISDPVDIEEGAMLTAFQRCIEKQLAIIRRMKDRADCERLYRDALILAREADNRNFARRAEGDAHAYPFRLRDFPAGADVS